MGIQPMKYANGETPKRGTRRLPAVDEGSGNIRTVSPKEAEMMAAAIAEERAIEREHAENKAVFSGKRTLRLLTLGSLFAAIFRR